MIGFTLFAGLASAALSPDAVLGRWRTETRHGIVELERCGGSICGRLIGSDGLKADPNLLDVNNKDVSLRGRRMMNLQFLSGFTRGDGQWTGGTIYNGDDGGTYKATITPADGDHLKVRGCIVWPLCKTQTWCASGDACPKEHNHFTGAQDEQG